jgi:hypothetical protein
MTSSENDNNIEVIGLQSPLFARARNGLADAIIGLLSQLEDLGLDSGEINMKIIVELRNDAIPVPKKQTDSLGAVNQFDLHSYKSPTVHHQITHTLKQTTKYPRGNTIADGMELKRDEDGIFILVPVVASQMTLDE